MVAWHWFVLTFIIGIAELLGGGLFLIFLSMATLSTGFIVYFMSPSLSVQLVIFSVFAIISLAGAVVMRRRLNAVSDTQIINSPMDRMIGQRMTVVEPISATSGRVKARDGSWLARGSPADVGDEVVVVNYAGTVLETLRVDEWEKPVKEKAPS